MKFTVITIFPEMFPPFWDNGILRRAILAGVIRTEAVNPRDFTSDRHHVTDDRPYGGGCGMVMKPEPLAAAIRSSREAAPDALTVFLTPQGRPFTQETARCLSERKHLILVCGRYEGVDERVIDTDTDVELSIGDYVLTGGELPAMIVMDAVTRLIPGALGGEDSAERDSFSAGLLEHAHYTRPPLHEGEAVPEVLLSGHHAAIDSWRRETSLIRTALKRPDLLRETPLTPADLRTLRQWHRELGVLLDERETGR